MQVKMENITYVAGNNYCVLVIAKKDAERLNIANTDEVIVERIRHGIIIENKNGAALDSTSEQHHLNHTPTE